MTSLEQRVTTVEAQAFSPDSEQERLYLHCKLIDLEDKSCRDNVRFLVFPENIKGTHVHSFLRETLPTLIGLTFDPPWKFKEPTDLVPRAEIKPAAPDQSVCLLQHTQTRQLLQIAHTHGPFRMNEQTIWVTADFSKETSERRKAFLAL
ncbi:hypothetical protein NDU88_002930 [Pleurodeles waltl]|uniref:Uncharacterized protein n=1 Tax=Pleurodeles waltl TaxID=8319 RepID=A0AAV7W3A1_PLEWA|nr:hypothetical protein NDU88_002930 [Pleurodeles waltl]